MYPRFDDNWAAAGSGSFPAQLVHFRSHHPGHLQSLMPHLGLAAAPSELDFGNSRVSRHWGESILAFGGRDHHINYLAVWQLRHATMIVMIWWKGIVAMFVGGLVMALIGTVQVLNAERKIESNRLLS
jgi:hypothetical protein